MENSFVLCDTVDMIAETLGSFLARQRRAARMTQPDVADAVGVTLRSVSNWEKGHSTPKPDSLKKLASLFRLKLDDLAQYLTSEQVQEYAEFTGTEAQRRKALELTDELLNDPRKLDEWLRYGEFLRRRDSDESQ